MEFPIQIPKSRIDSPRWQKAIIFTLQNSCLQAILIRFADTLKHSCSGLKNVKHVEYLIPQFPNCTKKLFQSYLYSLGKSISQVYMWPALAKRGTCRMGEVSDFSCTVAGINDQYTFYLYSSKHMHHWFYCFSPRINTYVYKRYLLTLLHRRIHPWRQCPAMLLSTCPAVFRPVLLKFPRYIS